MWGARRNGAQKPEMDLLPSETAGARLIDPNGAAPRRLSYWRTQLTLGRVRCDT